MLKITHPAGGKRARPQIVSRVFLAARKFVERFGAFITDEWPALLAVGMLLAAAVLVYLTVVGSAP